MVVVLDRINCEIFQIIEENDLFFCVGIVRCVLRTDQVTVTEKREKDKNAQLDAVTHFLSLCKRQKKDTQTNNLLYSAFV